MRKSKIERENSEEKKVDWPAKICTGSAGAVGELLVSADLISRGYSVFRSLSPACHCDLVVLEDKNDESLATRFEVRTVSKSWKGLWYLPALNTIRADMLAAVLKNGQIGYEAITTVGEEWLSRSTVPFQLVRTLGLRGLLEGRLKEL